MAARTGGCGEARRGRITSSAGAYERHPVRRCIDEDKDEWYLEKVVERLPRVGFARVLLGAEAPLAGPGDVRGGAREHPERTRERGA